MAVRTKKGAYYVYNGINRDHEKETGMVYATSAPEARRAVQKHMPVVKSCFKDPIANATWAMRGRTYAKIELAQVFRIIADNLEKGSSLPDSISLARLFTSDMYLKCACLSLIDHMAKGKSLAMAMQLSHFSLADCTVIEAVRGGGGSGGYVSAFRMRAEAIEFEGNAERELNLAVIPFIAFMIFLSILIWVSIFVLGRGDMLHDIIPQKNQTGLLGTYINFLLGAKENIGVASAFYAAGCLAIIVPLLIPRSRHFAIALLFRSYGSFRIELDQYKTWQLWQLLRLVGMDNVRIFALAVKVVSVPMVAQQNTAIVEQTRRGRGLASIIREVVKSRRLKDQLSSVLDGKSADKGMEMVLSLQRLNIDVIRESTVTKLSFVTKIIVLIGLMFVLGMIMAPSFVMMANIH